MNKKILIIQLRPGLGDFCMFLPRCHEIALNNPNYDITVLTKKNTKADQLLFHDHLIKNVAFIDDNKRKMKLKDLFLFLKKNNFHKVYSYQYGPKYLKYIILSRLAGIKEIYFYGVLKKKEDMVIKSIKSNEKWLGINITNFEGKIITPSIKPDHKKIIVGLGASGDNKRWPNNYFIELINKLNKRNEYYFILAGGVLEKKYIDEITSISSAKNFISLEKLNILESIEIIKNSDFFVGNDTGFMHVSACLNIKSFCLYGDTPSKDSIYNKNILPILPPRMSETYHDDLAMHKIKPEYVYNIIKEKIFFN
tara:strand:- start:218 stop:1144 length:927 start_codon:yes stop_codon:yes gene_type:complete